MARTCCAESYVSLEHRIKSGCAAFSIHRYMIFRLQDSIPFYVLESCGIRYFIAICIAITSHFVCACSSDTGTVATGTSCCNMRAETMVIAQLDPSKLPKVATVKMVKKEHVAQACLLTHSVAVTGRNSTALKVALSRRGSCSAVQRPERE